MLVFSLLLLFKLIKVKAEIRSWIWLSSILALVLVPVLFIGLQKLDWISIDFNDTQNNGLVDQANLYQSVPWQQQNTNQQIINDIVEQRDNVFNLQQLESLESQSDNSHLNDLDLNNNVIEAETSWKNSVTKLVLQVFPYLLISIILISLIKFMWLLVQCGYEFRIKARATEHLEKNIYYSKDVFVPSLVGLINKKVLLPENVKTISEKNRQFIIEHELAHMARRDQLSSISVRLIECVVWFSPLFHIMNNELKHTREVACDHRAINKLRVLNGNFEEDSVEIDYATMLVDSVKLFLMDKQKGGYLNLLSKKGFFRSRVNEIVNNNNKIGKNKSMWLSFISCFALLVSASVFANNATHDNQFLKSIDKFISDENNKKDIKVINNFFKVMSEGK